MNVAVKESKEANALVAPDITDLDQLLEDYGYFASGFMPGQLEATKKALRKFLDEGDAPHTAVHKAVARHAPAQATKHFKVDRMGQRVGGNYTAVDHGNGFFSILDIPIFAEVPAGAKRNKERIGEEWMDRAIEQNRMRRKEGHLPPVHIYHSDETAVKPSYAGKFVITKRGTITYEGHEIPALFANITDIPAEVFERIKTGVLPYRSVEVHDWDNPEIDSLALMDTDVPFFRMAMTTIGSVKKGESPVGFRHTFKEPTPLHWISHQRQQTGAMICFRFDDRKGGANMATEISTVKKGNTSKGLENTPKGSTSSKTSDGLTDQNMNEGKLGPNSGTDTEDQDAIAGLDDGMDEAPGGTDDAQVKMDDGMGGPPQATPGTDPAPGGDPMSAIMALLQQIASKLGCGPGPTQPAAPEVPQQNLAPVSGMRAAAVERIMLKAVLPLQMEVKRLRAVEQKSNALARVASLVAAAKNDLEGWPVDAEVEATLFKAAQGGYLEDVVELIKKTQPVDPPDSPAAFESMLAGLPEGDEVAKFMAENPGPKQNEWVRAQAKAHRDWVAQSGSTITMKEWLEANKYGDKIGLTSQTRGR